MTRHTSASIKKDTKTKNNVSFCDKLILTASMNIILKCDKKKVNIVIKSQLFCMCRVFSTKSVQNLKSFWCSSQIRFVFALFHSLLTRATFLVASGIIFPLPYHLKSFHFSIILKVKHPPHLFHWV